MARTPKPGVALKSLASGTFRPRCVAARATAAASGCSEPRSAAATRRSSASGVVRASPAPAGRDVGHRRPALGDRAGLVEHDRAHGVSGLERGAVADEHTVLGAFAGAYHDGRRGGQAQRARAGDDQHGDGVDEGVVHGGLRSGQQPHHERGRGDHHDGRHEPARDQVGEAGDRRPRALGLFDQAHDLRERRLGAHAGGAERERAGRVQRGADDLVAGLFDHRQRFAGEHRLVDGRDTLDDDAVDRHLLAGAHAHEVAVHDLGDRQVELGAVAHHSSRARLQPDQRADGLAGLALGARLEQAPEQDEGDDERGRVEVHGRAQAVVVEETGEEDAGGAVEVGRRGAQRDQRVHGRAAVARRGQGGAVELAPYPELHRRGQRPQHPAVGEKEGTKAKPMLPRKTSADRTAPTATLRRRRR